MSQFKPYRYTMEIRTEEEESVMNLARQRRGRKPLKSCILESLEEKFGDFVDKLYRDRIKHTEDVTGVDFKTLKFKPYPKSKSLNKKPNK